MPADQRQSFSAKLRCPDPRDPWHRPFPERLQAWAPGPVAATPARLPAVPTAAAPRGPRRPASSLGGRSAIPNADLRTAVWRPGSSEELLCLHTSDVIQQQRGIQTCASAMQGVLQHPSSPGTPPPQALPQTSPPDALSPTSRALLSTHFVLCRLSWDLFFQILVLLKGIML